MEIGLLNTSRDGHGYTHLHPYCMCTNLATWLALQCYRFYKYTPGSHTVEVCSGKRPSDRLTLVEVGVVPTVKKDSYIHRIMTSSKFIYLSARFITCLHNANTQTSPLSLSGPADIVLFSASDVFTTFLRVRLGSITPMC